MRFGDITPIISLNEAFSTFLTLARTYTKPISQFVSRAVKKIEQGISESTARIIDGFALLNSKYGSS